MGRWLNRDPISYDGVMNLYAYCGNDPVNKIDILGLEGEDEYLDSLVGGKSCSLLSSYHRIGATTPFTPMAMDQFQNGLYSYGMIPVVGPLFDVINAGISIARGKYFQAALAIGASVPIGEIASPAFRMTSKLSCLAIDIATEKTAALLNRMPEAMEPLGRVVGKSKLQNEIVSKTVEYLQKIRATDIRVNQCQVDVSGKLIGINRPDLQYTFGGKRFYIEYDTIKSTRSFPHEKGIISNDPLGIVTLVTMN